MPETTSTPALPRQPANGTNPPVPAEATKYPHAPGAARPARLVQDGDDAATPDHAPRRMIVPVGFRASQTAPVSVARVRQPA